MQDAILQLVVAAAPAVALFFTGWSYLYFYLKAFNINISEINFDLATVFIYSYPPLQALWETHWPMIVAVAALLLLAWLFAARIWVAIGWLSPWLKRRGTAAMARIRVVSPIAWTLALLVVIVFVLPLPLKSLTSWSAARAATAVWEGRTGELVPFIDKPPVVSSRFDIFKLVALKVWQRTTSKELNPSDALADDFDKCQKRSALELIFAVEQRYYLLCKGEKTDTAGAVFEVKGKEGLSSVRYVDRARAEADR